MTELKPCPFCGGKAKRRYEMPYNWVECSMCRAASPFIFDEQEQRDGMKEVVAAWNRRDGVQVARAKWLIVKGSNGKEYHACSHCSHEQEVTGVKNFCAVCGARMDGGSVNE